MSVIQPSSSTQRLAYAGGNEVFFSFLRNLMESVDQKLITQEQYRAILRQWGASLAQQAGLRKDLLTALEQLSELLSVMGLVRVFEPAQTESDAVPMILIMRCMTSRILYPARHQKSLPTENVIALLLEGALDSLGFPFQILQDNQDSLHGDEYILRLEPR